MKKLILILFVLPLVLSCTKAANESVINDPETLKITEYLKKTEAKVLVDELRLWKSFSNKINWEKEPEQFTYQNGNLKSIAFHLRNSDENVSFNSLVVFYKDRKFMPVITKGEKIDSQKNKISYFTTENTPYLSFTIDNEQKISNYKTIQKIPFKETFEERFKGQTIFVSGTTCLESTSNFGDCAECVIDEITDSYIASLGCMVFGTACAATVVVMCGAAQLG